MNLLPAFCASPRADVSALVNRILCCDAIDLLGSIPDNSIDMILTSPPYDNLRTYNGFTWDFEGIARESYRVLKQGGVLVWVVGDATVNGSETLTSFEQALYFKKQVGFKMHDTMIWNKYLPGLMGKRYTQCFEFMLVFSKDDVATFNPIMRRNSGAGKKQQKSQRSGYITQNGHVATGGEYTVAELSIEENVWRIQHTDSDGQHPASFPLKLANDHIYTWSNVGDVVLDFFMGSGTTAVAARNLGRKYIGCDLSPEYVALANTRLANTDPYQHSTLPDGSKQLSLFAALETVEQGIAS